MGRGANDKSVIKAIKTSGNNFQPPVVEGIDIIQPDTPPDIGSEAHRKRLEEYARARTNRTDVRVSLNGSCAVCGHHLDDHPKGGGCKQSGCDPREEGQACSKYVPNGQSATNMQGGIQVQADVPPDQGLVERELVINGFLRHEVCHELYTDPEVFYTFMEDINKMAQVEQKPVAAGQLQTFHNILEDGMIEERERELKPGAYGYISAMNKIYPRLGRDEGVEVENEYMLRAPDDYVPTDIDGKKLPIKTLQEILDSNKQLSPEERKMFEAIADMDQKMVVVPAGTRLSPWGKAPLNVKEQAMSAVHAQAIPEFEAGELHPRVKKALKECQEHIDAAVSGNTADCVARAYAIHAILRKHDLLDEDMTDEEREFLEQLAKEMGQVAPSAPQMGGGPPQSGSGGQPASNGMPQQQPGQEQMSNELSDQVGGDGDQQGQGGGAGGDEDGDGDEEGQGKGGSGDEEGDKEGSGGDKDGEGEGEGEGDQQGQGGGQQGGQQPQGQGGEQGGQDSGDSQNGQQGGGGWQGSFDQSGGFDPSRPIPKEAIQENAAQNKGSVSADKLEEMKKSAQSNLDADKAAQVSNDQRNIRGNRLEADNYKFDDGSQAIPQSKLASKTPGGALENEQGQLSQMGNQLAQRLKRLKSETRAPERYRRRGKLDPRRYGAAMAGNPRVYYKKGVNLDLDMELDISIDRSGSVGHGDTQNQYRMAKMFAHAGKESKIPTTIYGWDGSGWGAGGTSHYAYKERHSDDGKGIDAIFQTGGGGTPTAAGVRFSRKRLANSKAGQKIMVVITDGGAADAQAAREQVESAEREGIQVVGMAFQATQGGYASIMDEQFGRNNWVSIDSYTDAPRIIGQMIEKIAQQSALKARR